MGHIPWWTDYTREPGSISLEGHINADPYMAYYFDNMSVCELSAPFATSMYKPPAQ